MQIQWYMTYMNLNVLYMQFLKITTLVIDLFF